MEWPTTYHNYVFSSHSTDVHMFKKPMLLEGFLFPVVFIEVESCALLSIFVIYNFTCLCFEIVRYQ